GGARGRNTAAQHSSTYVMSSGSSTGGNLGLYGGLDGISGGSKAITNLYSNISSSFHNDFRADSPSAFTGDMVTSGSYSSTSSS
ncbi:unnamed protein product, partial [Didymodactylos carnosus]